METKVIIDLVCIYCGSTLQIRKKRGKERCTLNCPCCNHELRVLFNISTDPQVYSFLPAEKKAEDTAEKAGDDENSKDAGEEEEPRRPADKFKTVHKKKHKRARYYDGYTPGESDEDDEEENERRGYDDEDDDDDDFEKRRPRKKKPSPEKPRQGRRVNLYITRKKLFGLIAERYQLCEGKTVIGRDDADQPSDINIAGDETISRRSVEINVIPDSYGYDYTLKVLSASNPVRVNGKRIERGQKVYIQLGDTITVGHTTLKFDEK